MEGILGRCTSAPACHSTLSQSTGWLKYRLRPPPRPPDNPVEDRVGHRRQTETAAGAYGYSVFVIR